MQIFIRGISIYKTCNTQTINDIENTDSVRTLYLILNNMFKLNFEHYYLYYQSKILDHKSNKKLTTGQTQSGNVVRGTKDLMRGIQDDINPEQIEDIEPED